MPQAIKVAAEAANLIDNAVTITVGAVQRTPLIFDAGARKFLFQP